MIPDNYPPLIDWMLRNDLICSVSRKDSTGKKTRDWFDRLSNIWDCYGDFSVVAQDKVSRLMSLMGLETKMYFSSVKLTERKFFPSFPTPDDSFNLDDFSPNLTHRWRRWGQQYIILKTYFKDLEGRNCSCFLGYAFPNDKKPWWSVLYTTSSGKVIVVDDLKPVINHLANLGYINKEKFDRAKLPNLNPNFQGAMRMSIDDSFFQGKRTFTNSEFKRY